MSELQPFDRNTVPSSTSVTRSEQLELYDRYGSLAYGVILKILPQPHLAQEVLISLFATAQLQGCASYPFTFAGCVIKMARAKALEAKEKITSLASDFSNEITEEPVTPEYLFDLTFRQGLSPDVVAERLKMSRQEVLKGIHTFFKSIRQS